MDRSYHHETSTKYHPMHRPEKGIFDNELPEVVKKSSILRDGQGWNNVANQSVSSSVMLDCNDSPTPYPCLIAQLSLVCFNTVSLQCIGLAIGVSLFSIVFSSALEQSSAGMAGLCGVNVYINSLSVATQLIRTQAYGGVNATIWNMNQSAVVGLKSEFQSYAAAGAAVCYAQNSAAANATDSMARWSTNRISKLRSTTMTLFDSLKDVEHALENSDYFNGSTGNISSVLQMEIPSDSFQLKCQNISADTISGALKQVQIILNSTQSRLASIMNDPLPVINDTRIANISASLPHTSSFGIEKPTRIWVTLFSVTAFLAIFPTTYKLHSCWRYQLGVVKSLLNSLPFDLLQTFHSMSHPMGASIAKALSGVFISSGHSVRKTYVQWAVNYSISSNLNRLLHICIFLGILGIANSTILEAAKVPHCDARIRESLYNSGASLQTSLRESLNQNLFKLMSGTVKELDENHTRLVKLLRNVTKLNLGHSPSPFSNGLALEYVQLPAVNSWPQLTDTDDPAEIVSSLQSVNSAIWIPSITLFALWVFFAGSACAWAFYKAYKTPESIERYNTPISRF